MERRSEVETAEFLSRIKKGELKVYREFSPGKQSVFPTFVVLIVCMIGVYAVLVAVPSRSDLVALVIAEIPLVIVPIVAYCLVIRHRVAQREFGVRGCTRMELSAAIEFLDYAHERILTPWVPRGATGMGSAVAVHRTPMMMFEVAAGVLARMQSHPDSDLVRFMVREKQRQFTLRSRVSLGFIGVGCLGFGAFGLVIVYGAAGVPSFPGLVGALPHMFPLNIIPMILLFAGFFGCIFSVGPFSYTRQMRIINTLQNPEIYAGIEKELQYIIDTIYEEGEFPLKVTVVGEFDGLTYTGRTYPGPSDHTLREAILLPRRLGGTDLRLW